VVVWFCARCSCGAPEGRQQPTGGSSWTINRIMRQCLAAHCHHSPLSLSLSLSLSPAARQHYNSDSERTHACTHARARTHMRARTCTHAHARTHVLSAGQHPMPAIKHGACCTGDIQSIQQKPFACLPGPAAAVYVCQFVSYLVTWRAVKHTEDMANRNPRSGHLAPLVPWYWDISSMVLGH